MEAGPKLRVLLKLIRFYLLTGSRASVFFGRLKRIRWLRVFILFLGGLATFGVRTIRRPPILNNLHFTLPHYICVHTNEIVEKNAMKLPYSSLQGSCEKITSPPKLLGQPAVVNAT